MKKIWVVLLACFLGLGTVSQAQVVKKAAHGVKKGAKKVGNKTAEIASKGAAKVADETVDDRVGPNGEKIYVDDGNKYFWIDKKGKRHYVPVTALKPKN